MSVILPIVAFMFTAFAAGRMIVLDGRVHLLEAKKSHATEIVRKRAGDWFLILLACSSVAGLLGIVDQRFFWSFGLGVLVLLIQGLREYRKTLA